MVSVLAGSNSNYVAVSSNVFDILYKCHLHSQESTFLQPPREHAHLPQHNTVPETNVDPPPHQSALALLAGTAQPTPGPHAGAGGGHPHYTSGSRFGTVMTARTRNDHLATSRALDARGAAGGHNMPATRSNLFKITRAFRRRLSRGATF